MSKKLATWRSTFFFTLIVFLSGKASAYYELNPTLQSAYLATMNLDFDKADKLLSKEKIEKPGNDLSSVYRINIYFLKAFISEEESSFEELKRQCALTLKYLDKTDDNFFSPWHSYSKAEIMIQEAMVKVKFREYVSAAVEIRKAYRLIEKNKIKFPDFILNKKLNALLEVIVGSVPREYQWLTEIAGMEGSAAVGTKQLTELLTIVKGNEYYCYRQEILFYLTTILTTFNSKDEELQNCLDELSIYNLQSPLMRYCSSSILIKLGRNEAAISLLKNPESYLNTFPFYFMYYKLAVCKMRKLDFSATKDFLTFVNSYKGKNYIKSSFQKLSWIELLNNNLSGVEFYSEKCRLNGDVFIDEDKEALRGATSVQTINSILLKTRLLFDGGYYSKALAELSNKSIQNFPTYKDQLEVTYRLARIYEETNELDKAIDLFQKTINNGSSASFYFAANSALQLGMIYENKKDFLKAEEYYKKCLSMGTHEYQNSLDQKAKAGLDRLKLKQEP